MANHKSAVKAHKQSLKNKARNQSIISKVKTFIKKFEEMLKSGSKEDTKTAFVKAESEIMKSASKGVMKKKTASRKVSRLNKKMKAAKAK